MIFLKLLLNSVLIFIGGTAIDTDSNLKNKYVMSEFPLRLQKYVTPMHYNVTFDLEKVFYGSEAENFIYGICKAVINIEQSTPDITLHAQYPQIEIIEFVTLTATTINHSIGSTNKYLKLIAASSIYYDKSTNVVMIVFKKEIQIEEYIMQMKFRGSVGEFEGFFKSVYTNEGFKK